LWSGVFKGSAAFCAIPVGFYSDRDGTGGSDTLKGNQVFWTIRHKVRDAISRFYVLPLDPACQVQRAIVERGVISYQLRPRKESWPLWHAFGGALKPETDIHFAASRLRASRATSLSWSV